MIKVYIYVLIDPITYEIRYIGKSINPTGRLKKHIRSAKYPVTHKECWINGLITKGYFPFCDIIDTVSEQYANIAEIIWIRYGKLKGWNLTNRTPGGDGGNTFEGKQHTDEWKLKHSERFSGENNPMYGRKASDETRMKMSESHKIRLKDKNNHPMYGKHNAGVNKGRKASPETKRKMSESQLKRFEDPEEHRKLSEAQCRRHGKIKDE